LNRSASPPPESIIISITYSQDVTASTVFVQPSVQHHCSFGLERIWDFRVSNLGSPSHVRHGSQTDDTQKNRIADCRLRERRTFFRASSRDSTAKARCCAHFGALVADGQSKLACLMFALELQRRSDAAGRNLMSIAAHPGFSRTGLFASGPGGLVSHRSSGNPRQRGCDRFCSPQRARERSRAPIMVPVASANCEADLHRR
jgi:NAD(P)-dependent dehydrogenase (short-subunit alcohol dehydrogenase family)